MRTAVDGFRRFMLRPGGVLLAEGGDVAFVAD